MAFNHPVFATAGAAAGSSTNVAFRIAVALAGGTLLHLLPFRFFSKEECGGFG